MKLFHFARKLKWLFQLLFYAKIEKKNQNLIVTILIVVAQKNQQD